MLLVTLITPLIGSIVSGFFGRYLGANLSKIFVTLTIFISMIASYSIYIDVILNDQEITLNILPWISIEYLEIDWAFTIDKLSGSMLIPVTTISFFVHIFACSYMSSDPHQPRFFSYLSLFTFFMLILVTGNSYLTMFIGWEFVGVTSYLLISFWFTRITAMKSALSAILLNRMGDTFFIIGMLLLISTFGSLNFATVFSLTPYIDSNILYLIMLCFLIATAAKSAQFGLHNWLLLAMEGKKNSIKFTKINLFNEYSYNPSMKKKYSNRSHTIFKRDIYTKNEYNNKGIYVYDLYLNSVCNEKIFSSISECSMKLHISRNTISKYLNTHKLFKSQYIFSTHKLDGNIINSLIVFTPILKNIITGFLLGDGHLRKLSGNRSNSRLEFTIGIKNIDYANYIKYTILNQICTNSKLTFWPKENPSQCWFSTKSYKYFTDLCKSWYYNDKVLNQRIKRLPYNLTENFSKETLAYWFMDDGYSELGPMYFLCTDNFTLKEVHILQKLLKNKFNLDSGLKIRKNNNKICYRIKILKKSSIDFKNIIKPYIIPSMKYKLKLNMND